MSCQRPHLISPLCIKAAEISANGGYFEGCWGRGRVGREVPGSTYGECKGVLQELRSSGDWRRSLGVPEIFQNPVSTVFFSPPH